MMDWNIIPEPTRQEVIALRELKEAIAEMRRLQKEYFRYRDQDTLVASKTAERKVDEKLKAMEAEECSPSLPL